jgi:hypothetical protein
VNIRTGLAITAAIIVGLIAATRGSAQTATFTLDRTSHDQASGSFQLRITISDGQNAGIASYGVKLTGDITFDHRAPGIASANGSAGNGEPAGFTLFRTADRANPAAGLLVTASQDTVTPTPYIYYGVGRSDGNVLTSPTHGPITIATAGDQTQNADYAASFVIGTGTWSGQPPAFDQDNADNGVQVFTADDALDTQAADLAFELLPRPEPTQTLAVPATTPAGLVALAAVLACAGAWVLSRANRRSVNQ